ncbi:MAG: hypothetical protein QXP70_05275, partial [Methanomassiliicoccales archaeon]
MEEEKATYKLINAGGNHYDIGRKMTDAITEALLSKLTSPISEERAQQSIASAETAFAAHPVLRDEVQGICEGISIDIEAMLAEISDTSAGKTETSTVLCKTADGNILLGRSLAAAPETHVRNLLRLDPNDSYASLGRMAGYFGGTWESTSVFGYSICVDITGNTLDPTGIAAYMVPRMLT